LLQDSWLVVRIIIHGPLVGQKTISVLKIFSTAVEASDYVATKITKDTKGSDNYYSELRALRAFVVSKF